MTSPEYDCISEIREDMATIKADIRNLLTRMQGYVPEHCISHTEKINQLTGEIEGIKATQVWLWRTVVSAIIAAGTIPLLRLIV